MITRLADLREPPIVGQFYMVPAVRFIWCGVDALWPVLGPLHTDARFFNFPAPHYHVDARFVNKGLAKRAQIHSSGIVAQTQRSPLAKRIVPDAPEVPTGRPIEARLKCQMTAVGYHFHHQGTVSDLRHAYGDIAPGHRAKPIRLSDGRILCPHRKVDLSTFPLDDEGAVTCPLHGLRVQCEIKEPHHAN